MNANQRATRSGSYNPLPTWMKIEWEKWHATAIGKIKPEQVMHNTGMRVRFAYMHLARTAA